MTAAAQLTFEDGAAGSSAAALPRERAPELAAILDEQAKDARRREKDARHARRAPRVPRRFDPACLFLLDLHPDNLYDPTPSAQRFRCRGCSNIVGRRDRARHHHNHRRSAK